MKTLHLFEAFGIEVEYMIVNKDTLMPDPAAGEIIKEVMGDYVCTVDRGEMSWSNEFVMHVIEIQAADPCPIPGTDRKIYNEVLHINRLLEKHNAMLMPTGAHPFLNPLTDARLWPYENKHIYATFNRIFNCLRHGWVNLQSCQINLPFCGDSEFEVLHAAIRFLMPVMPALSASTPVAEGKRSDFADFRLDTYRSNSSKIPSITGSVIPEPCYSYEDYQTEILEKIYRDIKPHDTDGILGYEWLNARGAIARFDRNAIEIRILDMQECPSADVAVCDALVSVIKKLVNSHWVSIDQIKKWSTSDLRQIYDSCVRSGDQTVIHNTEYLECFGIGGKEIGVRDFWKSVLAGSPVPNEVSFILDRGNLSSRILRALNNDYGRQNLVNVYRRLCGCLSSNRQFDPDLP